MSRLKKTIQATGTKAAIPHTYKCQKCGKEYDTPVKHFFKVSYTHIYDANDKYSNICVKCLNEMFNDYKARWGEKTAMVIICHYLDIPFYYSLYDSIIQNNDGFTIGMYTRVINGRQYAGKTFVNTLMDKRELEISQKDYDQEKEIKWTASEIRTKNLVIDTVGYDPFEDYSENDRRFLFNEIIKYFDEDITDDTYKIASIIQIVNNNNQIRRYDKLISNLNPTQNPEDIKNLNELKSQLVKSNDRIAKENEISVKNRSNKNVGKGTLSNLMKELREKNFDEAEENYYDQLRSVGTQWAIDMSNKSIREHCFIDENDQKEMFLEQRELIQKLQSQLDDITEENRLLKVENKELRNNQIQ